MWWRGRPSLSQQTLVQLAFTSERRITGVMLCSVDQTPGLAACSASTLPTELPLQPRRAVLFSGLLSSSRMECVHLEGGRFLTAVLRGTKVLASDRFLGELGDRRVLCTLEEAVGSLMTCV